MLTPGLAFLSSLLLGSINGCADIIFIKDYNYE